MTSTTQSEQLFAEAQALMPGGVSSPVRAFKSVGGVPRFIARGEGAYMIDVDGNRYIDYVMSFGPLLLGHAPRPSSRAIAEQAARGTSFGAPSPLEVDLAETIQAIYPSMERLRFVNSGTEGAMSAVRAARAFTERDKVVKFDGPLPRPRRPVAGQGRQRRRHARPARLARRPGRRHRRHAGGPVQRRGGDARGVRARGRADRRASWSSPSPATWGWSARARASCSSCARSRASTARCWSSTR